MQIGCGYQRRYIAALGAPDSWCLSDGGHTVRQILTPAQQRGPSCKREDVINRSSTAGHNTGLYHAQG